MKCRNVYHFEVVEATDFEQSFLYLDPTTQLPIDLTGYSADMRLKQNGNGTYDGYGTLDIVLELSTATGGITLGGTNGAVIVSFTAEQLTNALWNRAVYNLILTNTSGDKIPFMYGFVTIQSDTVF